MSYFHHSFVSNSDLKKIVARHDGKIEPDNLQAIFDFGTEFHASILEPHKVNWDNVSEENRKLIERMRATFWRDKLCSQIVMQHDFRREHEFYRVKRFGLKGVRCKCDGETKSLRVILELKGLSVSREKQFIESIEHLDYDQGGAWYLNVTNSAAMITPNYDYKLIAGISKYDPDLMFKVLINRNHVLYKSGMEKVKRGVTIWKQFGLE